MESLNSLNDHAIGSAEKRKFSQSEINLIRTKLHIADLYYYHIYAHDQRRGYVEIRRNSDSSRFTINIHINSLDRGRGIGTHAYFLACKLSGLSTVYAHMSKQNTASKIAAERAGFKVIENVLPNGKKDPQLTLVWKK